MSTTLIVIAIILVFAAVAVTLIRPKTKLGAYRRRQIMTENEIDFFHRLCSALPGYFVCPQVSMLALVEPSNPNKQHADRDRLRVAQQRVDFVVMDRAGHVISIVELDDRTHNIAKDRLRDERTNQAGYTTHRFQSKAKPTIEQLRSVLLPESVSANSNSS